MQAVQSQPQSQPAGPGDTIVARIRRAVQDSLKAGEQMTPAVEAEVHRALDLLHREGEDGERLRKIEDISCRLHHMRACLRSGRVNAYASNMLRLRRLVESL